MHGVDILCPHCRGWIYGVWGHVHCRTQVLWGGSWVVWTQGSGLQSQCLTTVAATVSQVGTRLWGTKGPAQTDGGYLLGFKPSVAHS